jgi:hypothetical protein
MNEVVHNIGTIIGFIATMIVAVIAYAYKNDKRDIERRLQENETERHALAARYEQSEKERRKKEDDIAERLRVDELETERLKGQNALLQQAHAGVMKSLENQVPRAEWERQNKYVDSQLSEILRRLDRAQPYPGRYPSQTSMPAQNPPSSDPRR